MTSTSACASSLTERGVITTPTSSIAGAAGLVGSVSMLNLSRTSLSPNRSAKEFVNTMRKCFDSIVAFPSGWVVGAVIYSTPMQLRVAGCAGCRQQRPGPRSIAGRRRSPSVKHLRRSTGDLSGEYGRGQPVSIIVRACKPLGCQARRPLQKFAKWHKPDHQSDIEGCTPKRFSVESVNLRYEGSSITEIRACAICAAAASPSWVHPLASRME